MYRRVYGPPPPAPDGAGDYLMALLDLRDRDGDIVHLWLSDKPGVFFYRWVFAKEALNYGTRSRRLTYDELIDTAHQSTNCFVKILDEALFEHAHKKRLEAGAAIAVVLEGKCGN